MRFEFLFPDSSGWRLVAFKLVRSRAAFGEEDTGSTQGHDRSDEGSRYSGLFSCDNVVLRDWIVYTGLEPLKG